MGTDRSSFCAFPASPRLMSLLFLCFLLLAPVYAQNQSIEVFGLANFITWASPIVPPGAVFLNTWNFSDENACAWAGVVCTTNYTVVELDLSGWGLQGYFVPETLSNLTDLSHLDLSFNEMFLFNESIFNESDSGSVSTLVLDIGSLTGLIWLDLSQNQLAGELSPSISACQHLRFLSLSQNQLEGAIPSSLSDLTELQFLLLDHNRFSGPLSTELTGLSDILYIDLSYNGFNGSIPVLPKLTKLFHLVLDSNNFTKFEESWFSIVSQSLEVLSVSFNQLEEALPSEITLPNLYLVNLTGNRLSGKIPRFYSAEVSDFWLDLSGNQFTGEIPSYLFQIDASLCRFLNLSHNFLIGNVPFNGNQTCILALDLSHNSLSGSQFLPFNISNLGNTTLNVLRLGNNQLSGDAVDILSSAGLMFVEEFRLENNLFTGDLSKLISTNSENWVFLQVVDLSNNYLQWSISDEIPDPITLTLQKLAPLEFRVGSNNYSGTSLPSECSSNKSELAFFSLSSFPLQVLDLSDSHLNGSILSAAFNSTCLPNIQFLNLSNNDITGLVPYSILDMSSLEVLDLSSNHLTGHLPMLPFNSSFNNPSLFEGNDGLCGYPLSPCPQHLLGTGGIQWWVVLIIVGACVMIPLGSCLVATWRWRVYDKRHQQDADLIKILLSEKESATIMSLRELKKATENFAESAQIGEGGFGTVYIGKLNKGTMVAIKRSKHEGSEKDKIQFLNEVRILSQVNHRNLVKLLGCCMENKIALLVFEYVPNGTLQEHLCGKFGELRLSWTQRVHIAMQTATALNYLHSATVIPIYHRDVKSSNILLDENLSAKVADFGISKLAPLNATHVSTIAIQGTIGYIDPEYYTSYQLTDKSDVYSFGMVLLELISAKPALDFERGGDQTSLVHFASSCIAKGDWIELIDPALAETYNDLDGNGRKSILALSKLAFKCLEMQSKARPTMDEVLKELQNLWGKLKGMSRHWEDFAMEDDFEDSQHDHRVMLCDNLSRDSSSFPMRIDGNGIQMSQLSNYGSLNEIIAKHL